MAKRLSEESQVAQNNAPLYHKVAHNSLKVAPNYGLLAFQGLPPIHRSSSKTALAQFGVWCVSEGPDGSVDKPPATIQDPMIPYLKHPSTSINEALGSQNPAMYGLEARNYATPLGLWDV